MSISASVLVVGPQTADREAIVEALSMAGLNPETNETVTEEEAFDCLVGVPAVEEDPAAVIQIASKLGSEQPPTILSIGNAVDTAAVRAAGVDELVWRGSAGSEQATVEAVRRLTTMIVTDGGVETEHSSLERLHDIAADRELSELEKIDHLLEAGADRLGSSDAFLTRIEGDTQEVIRSVGDNPELEPGAEAPLSESYCQYTIEQTEPVAVHDAKTDDRIDQASYERFGLRCYFGTTIAVDGEPYGTVCFVDTDPREKTFTTGEETFLKVLTDWISYLLEQQLYKREIDQQRAFTDSLMDSLPDPLYATDDSGRLIRWNSQFEEIIGDGDLADQSVDSFVDEANREAFSEMVTAALAGQQRSIEATVETSEDSWTPFEFSSGPLHDETGSITGVAGVGRDITDRKRHHQRLSGILDTTRSLMQARDRNHVAEIAVNAAKELLGFEISVFRLYNSEAGTLEPVAMTDETRELFGERPVYEVGKGNPGDVFASGEPRTIDDLEQQFEPARSVMYYPVGVHGTLSVGSTEPAAFDETDEQMLALLGTSAAAACMRAKREQDVRKAQEHTERVLDRVNGLIQNTVEVLVQATTRAELERGVVRELAAASPYTFAWIGQPDIASETLSATAAAGDADLPVQGRSFELSHGEDPVALAYREQTPQILSEIEDSYTVWSEITAGSDVASLISIPLVYKDTNYGVLSVFSGENEAFDERERVVLESLGRVIANAINAIERGRILDATEIIELEFAINDPELLFSRLSSRADCVIESAGTDYLSDGRLRLYLTATGVDAERLLEIAEDDPGIEVVTLIVAHEDECLLEVTVAESLLETLTEYGAVPRAVTADRGDTRFTVELPYEAEARELFELVETQYPSTELLGYHERERPVETRQEFKAALSDRFTDRQETALRTAYLGGFFDWPRDIDGNELAEAMDISRPTYHQHLRAAQRKVFEELFE